MADTTTILPKDIPNIPTNGGLSPVPETFSFGVSADPVTAGLNAAGAFFTFLSTTQGQRVVSDIITLDQAFAKKCSQLFTKIHDKLTGNKS